MGAGQWRIVFTRRRLQVPQSDDLLFTAIRDLDKWLDVHDVPDGQPFLISPQGQYDVRLNRFFAQARMSTAPPNTQAAHAYDLKNFLDFLWAGRGSVPWWEATSDDRAAYERWRRKDPAGPRVEHATWDREVATVNVFFEWAIGQGYLQINPILQRAARVRGGWRAESRGKCT
jgi:hypothetical protein